MLFSINILLVIPKIIAIETIEEPPKLKSGKGKPVTGIIPTTVEIFINIWNKSNEMKPAITNLSKSEFETIRILPSLLIKRPHKPSRNKIPKKPKLYANAAKMKSVVSTGTNTFWMFSVEKYCPNKPPLEISNLLCAWEKSKSVEKNSFILSIWYWVTIFTLSNRDPNSRNRKNKNKLIRIINKK